MNSKIKKLTKETAIYGISIVIGRFLNFLLTPMYTNYLDKAEMAFNINLFAYIAFINILYSFGMESSFFRFAKSDKNEAQYDYSPSQVYSHSYFSILFLGIINSGLIFIFSDEIAPFIGFENAGYLIRIAAFIPLLDALVLIPFAYLRLNRQAKKFSLLRFLSILINVILNFIFLVNFDFGIMGILIAQVISSSISFAIFIPSIFKHLTFKFNKKLFVEMFKFGLPTVPASISTIALQVADRPIIEFISGKDIVSIYGVNYKLGIPMMMFVSVFEYAWKPFYLNHYKDADAKAIFSKVLTTFSIASMILILLWSFSLEFIVRIPFIGGSFINPAYWSGLNIVPIILFGYFFNGIFTNLNAGFLIEKKTKYLPLIVGLSALSNIVFLFLLVPKYGFYGGAWATFLAYLLQAILVFYYSNKIYPIKYEWKKIILISLITGTFILSDKLFFSSNFDLKILIIIRIVLIIIYLSTLFIFGFLRKLDFSFIKRK